MPSSSTRLCKEGFLLEVLQALPLGDVPGSFIRLQAVLEATLTDCTLLTCVFSWVCCSHPGFLVSVSPSRLIQGTLQESVFALVFSFLLLSHVAHLPSVYSSAYSSIHPSIHSFNACLFLATWWIFFFFGQAVFLSTGNTVVNTTKTVVINLKSRGGSERSQTLQRSHIV